MLNLTQSHILNISPYIPGRAIDESTDIKRWAKLASNENCLGPSPLAIRAAQKYVRKMNIYPNSDGTELKNGICQKYQDYNFTKEHIAVGNGSSELIVNIVRAFLSHKEVLLNFWPSFMMYRVAANTHGCREISVPLKASLDYDVEGLLKSLRDNHGQGIKLLFIANPNNPSCGYLSKAELDYIAKKLPPEVLLVIDEAYYDYAAMLSNNYPCGFDYVKSRPRTIVLRSFSKTYGLAGLRIGYAVSSPEIIEILNKVADTFHVNQVALVGAYEALKDGEFIKKSLDHNQKTKRLMLSKLIGMGFKVKDSLGNFLLIKRQSYMPSMGKIIGDLYEKGVIIRGLDNYGLKDYARVTVGTLSQTELLFKHLRLAI